MTSSMTGVLEAATRNANSSNDLALAAAQVIARRAALGLAAIFDPMGADHVEFGRMVPEKVEAFSAAGMIMMRHATQAGEQIAQFASDAVMAAVRATVAIVGSASPAAMAETQGQFAKSWFEQAASNFMAIGILALGAQEAALVPIQETLAANSARLGG
ncbi:MAG TPA: phasin family protein [Rhodopila sp.]|jgi:hypothetical protein